MSARRPLLLSAAAGVAAAAVAFALPGVTYALWHTELADSAAFTDAGVLFSVDGVAATSADPAVAVTIGAPELEALLTGQRFAIPVEVAALSQGNRGLRYDVTLPDAPADSILGSAQLSAFRVPDADACTVDADIPASTAQSSTPVPAVYSDSTVPEIEHWCVRADLGALPDVGRFRSTTTITGTHPDGEVVEEIPWDFGILTGFEATGEGPYEVMFAYETFRPEGEDDAP